MRLIIRKLNEYGQASLLEPLTVLQTYLHAVRFQWTSKSHNNIIFYFTEPSKQSQTISRDYIAFKKRPGNQGALVFTFDFHDLCLKFKDYYATDSVSIIDRRAADGLSYYSHLINLIAGKHSVKQIFKIMRNLFYQNRVLTPGNYTTFDGLLIALGLTTLDLKKMGVI